MYRNTLKEHFSNTGFQVSGFLKDSPGVAMQYLTFLCLDYELCMLNV